MATTSLILIFSASAIWASALFANLILGYGKLSDTSGNYRVRPRLRMLKRALFALALAWLAMAFSPVTVDLKTAASPQKEVVFVLDVSRSMDAIDEWEETSRLERAKTFVVGTVRKHPENAYSLTVFSGESNEAIPKTRDVDAFVTLLSGITSRYSNSVWTDFLNVWKSLSDRFSTIGERSRNPSVLTVILTDGWDAEDTPNTASLRSVFQGTEDILEILTVTFGSAKWANVPLWRDFMGWTVYQTDGRGNVVVTKSNRETWRRIAEATGGSEGSESSWEEIFDESLSKVVSVDGETEFQNNSVPISPFHFISLFMFVAAFMIPDKISPCFKKRSS